ncbi:hypothetical protein BH09PAT3_BH09PAT3_1770 [soil metagenome]
MEIPVEERKQIENEMLFRRANEKVGKDLDEIDELHVSDGNPHLVRSDDLLLDFKCECSDENCSVRIPLQLSIYRKIHVDRSTFLIKLNHEVKPIEKVIETTPTYSIVRKNNTTAEPIENAEYNDTSIDNSKS